MDSTAADETLVSVRDVTFRYGDMVVLRGVSLDILAGDFLALLGPNGSGKTTLLKIILGLLEPREGTVSLLGGSPADRFRSRPFIGYVPQNASHVDSFFPVSVREVVAMALRRRSDETGRSAKGEEGRALERALGLVGMSDFQERLIGSLSGGQQQRVFIARAVVNRPQLLFLDEPTTGVDAKTQDRFYAMLQRFNKDEGITIVLVTHDIGVVNKHVNKVACLNQTLTYHGSHEEFCSSAAFKEMISGGHHVISHRH